MKSVAIIGLGAVVHHIHMPAYAQLGNRIQVVAGCDANRVAREQAANKWGFRVYDDPLKMIETERPDIAVVCTPPWLHLEHVRLALGHGCHVFCEKPAASDISQVDQMLKASEEARRLVMVNNQFPCMNIHRAAKEQVGSKEFGELLYLNVWHTMVTNETTEAGWRGELSRRLGFEFGIHVLDLVRYLFDDEPSRLMAHMPNPRGRARCDVVNSINVEFPDGRGASIVLDRLSRGPERYLDMRLDGELASVHTSIGGRVRFQAGIHTRDRRPFVDLTFVKGGRAVLEKGNRSKILAKDGINPFADATARHFAGFLGALDTGGMPRGNIRENRNSLALVMAAYDSAASGQWIEIDRQVPQSMPAQV